MDTAVKLCAIEDCQRPVKGGGRGWCPKHYMRWLRHGDPLVTFRLHLSVQEYLDLYVVEIPDGCWVWTAKKDQHGYGRVGVRAAHRAVYELLVGPIPGGLVLDHLCRNPPCVNPAHLEPVTQRVTLRGQSRGAIAVRTGRCGQGHDLRIYGQVQPNGSRNCSLCRLMRARRRARERRELAW